MGKTFSTGLLTNGLWQDSSNNIGIGAAANASFKLQVTGTTNLTDNLTMTIASGTKSIGFGGNTIAAAANALIYSDTNYLVLNSKAGSPLYLNFDNANASSTINMFNGKFILTQAGNVGIGTNSPNDLLEIKSTTANQANVRLYNTFNDGSNIYGISWFRNYDSATNSQACFINYVREGGSGGYMSFGTGTVGNIAARMTITSGGSVCVNTTLVKSRLGTNTKFTVAGSGSNAAGNSGASMGAVAGSGASALDTGIDIEATDGGLTLLFLASRNTSGGTNTASAVYIISFYYSGTFPVVSYIGGTSNFVTFGQSGTSLTATNAIGYGNFNCSWFASK
jgi:hypothetical protein